MIREALARKIAGDEIAAIGLTGPPSDLDAIATRNGLSIQRGATLPSGIRARLRPIAGVIEVSAVGSLVERFAIAHELGHALLEHGDRACYDTPVYESTPLDEADTGINFEREASAFASFLLVPRSWLRSAVERGATLGELQSRFEITKPVLWIAIQDARLINKVRVSRD
jgi:hypothetical protein